MGFLSSSGPVLSLKIFQLNCVILVLRYKTRFTAAATRPPSQHSLSLSLLTEGSL
jgi:hypothetical protein